MQIRNINEYLYLLCIYEESFLKVFKHFKLIRVGSLGVGF